MKVKPTDKCICGHNWDRHEPTNVPELHPNRDHYCQACEFVPVSEMWHTFKLDNLSYLLKKYESKS